MQQLEGVPVRAALRVCNVAVICRLRLLLRLLRGLIAAVPCPRFMRALFALPTLRRLLSTLLAHALIVNIAALFHLPALFILRMLLLLRLAIGAAGWPPPRPAFTCRESSTSVNSTHPHAAPSEWCTAGVRSSAAGSVNDLLACRHAKHLLVPIHMAMHSTCWPPHACGHAQHTPEQRADALAYK
jgi:hypothetical protein